MGAVKYIDLEESDTFVSNLSALAIELLRKHSLAHLEESDSGPFHTLGKRAGASLRGFESHLLRNGID